ncbi:MAG TPA: hypothetical protein VK308_08920, partial [Pyrinomonadaceae bacterium]|nr:hypothetical protein [Pyrinomonadaceae bacterium]
MKYGLINVFHGAFSLRAMNKIMKQSKLRQITLLVLITIGFSFTAQLNVKAADGDLDTSFVSRLFGGIQQGTGVDISTAQSVALQPDGKMLVGGTFTSFASRSQRGIARLNADGSPDYAFFPSLNGDVRAVALQADGKILIGGDFTIVSGQPRVRVARLNADGSLDAAFQNPNANNTVYVITLQPDGRVLIGGRFDAVGGQQRLSLARINADGSLDTTFGNPPISSVSTVYAITLQADGRILVGGNIFVGSQSSYFGRLNANGTLDTTFQGYANDRVFKIKIQADGKILIGGSFTRVGPSNNRFDRKTLARLNADGTVDPSLGDIGTTVSFFSVYDFVTLPSGRIIIGGSPGFFAPRPGLARLESDGTIDLTFDAKIGGT